MYLPPDAHPSRFSHTSELCYRTILRCLESCVSEAHGTRRHCKLYSPFLFPWSLFGDLLCKIKMACNGSKGIT